MKNVRTLTELRNNLKGKIYIYLEDRTICKQFLNDAENEGFHFGKIKPTDSDGADIIALEKGKQLSYVGFVGHMAFQCPSGVEGSFYRIDYRKFANGDRVYTYSGKTQNRIAEFGGKFFERVTVVGDDYAGATAYIKKNLTDCKTIEEEENLYTAASQKFNVLVIEE